MSEGHDRESPVNRDTFGIREAVRKALDKADFNITNLEVVAESEDHSIRIWAPEKDPRRN